MAENLSTLIQREVSEVDLVVSASERRWGYGRLRLLVSPETRARFDEASALWDEAIASRDLQRVQKTGAMMRRAYGALAAEAEKAGNGPIDAVAWEVRMADGKTVSIVRTAAEAIHMGKQAIADGRSIEVWTVDDLAAVLAMPAARDIGACLRAWPGAAVTPAIPDNCRTGAAKGSPRWRPVVDDPVPDLVGGE